MTADDALALWKRVREVRNDLDDARDANLFQSMGAAGAWSNSHLSTAVRHLDDAMSALRSAAGHLLPDPE